MRKRDERVFPDLGLFDLRRDNLNESLALAIRFGPRLALGAQGAWMGTRFMASQEAHAAEHYKKRITEIGEDETSVTRCYSGNTMRVIRNRYVEDWEHRAEEIQSFPQQMAVSARNDVFKRGEPSATSPAAPRSSRA